MERVLRVRNGINHLLLNRIMILRYQLRRRPGCVRLIVGLEALCLKTGLLFDGGGRSGLQGKAGHV